MVNVELVLLQSDLFCGLNHWMHISPKCNGLNAVYNEYVFEAEDMI